MFERVDAVGFDAGLHLVKDLLVPPGDCHVEAVVARCAFGLATSVLIGGEQCLAGVRGAEVDNHRRATRERGLATPFKIVSRYRTSDGPQFKMRMRINTTWHDIASASINRLRSGRRFESCANRSDHAVANKNVGALRMVVVDDGAAAYETCHLYFQVPSHTTVAQNNTGRTVNVAQNG